MYKYCIRTAELCSVYTCIHNSFHKNWKERNMTKTSASSQIIYVWIVRLEFTFRRMCQRDNAS